MSLDAVGVLIEKQCTKCGVLKSVFAFARCTRNKNGLQSKCRDCDSKTILTPDSGLPRACTKCLAVKPANDFHNHKGSKVKKCKSCTAIDFAKCPSQTYEATRRRSYKLLYNTTPEFVDSLLASQNGVCAVCKGPPMGKGQYHVDHDHQTGKIRGLLCHKCNVALGMVQDNVWHLKALISYLEEKGSE